MISIDFSYGFVMLRPDLTLMCYQEREGNATAITDTGSTDESADFDQIAWYPQQKIEIASRKLRGENPACKDI